MKEKGFATSAILYTILLLFLVLMVGILNNLQNKKTLLDALKKDTIYALEKDTVLDGILNQIAIINSKINQFETKIGTTDISNIGDGTITGALSHLNSNLLPILNAGSTYLWDEVSGIATDSWSSMRMILLISSENTDIYYFNGALRLLDTGTFSYTKNNLPKYLGYVIVTDTAVLNHDSTKWINSYVNLMGTYTNNGSLKLEGYGNLEAVTQVGFKGLIILDKTK